MSDPLPLPCPGGIAVGSLAQANRHKRKFDAVLTLEDPRARPGERLRFTKNPAPFHLSLAFEDVDSDEFGYASATADQVRIALDFARQHATGSLLVHCFHGVGRSAAIALAILADRLGEGHEVEAVAELLAIRPEATPNFIVLTHADAILNRKGQLTNALSAFEQGRPDKLAARIRRHQYARENPSLYAKRA